MSEAEFNPNSVDLDNVDQVQVICYLSARGNGYDGRIGARVSALFVILIVSTAATFFPVIAERVNTGHKMKWFKMPTYLYLFARYFGAGIIIATAFIHLLDPAYSEIGPDTCVGQTGHWADYAWCPAIVLTSVMMIFLLDFGAQHYVEVKYNFKAHTDIEDVVTDRSEVTASDEALASYELRSETEVQAYQEKLSADKEKMVKHEFSLQFAGFLILEFGVLFHSVIIGLNLGSVGTEFTTLYPVLVFHQSFEGLGIGARMSAIPFPRELRNWLPWLLCLAYGLTTPIAIAVGLGVRTTYNPDSFTANVVSGVLDALSAGILLYTGLVELLARDFLFNPEPERDKTRLTFMIVCMLLGVILMALLGKWA